MVKSGIRYLEMFVAAFLATNIVLDLFTKGWAGVDLAAAWVAAGSYLPWLLGAWFGTWAVLTVGGRVWSWYRQSAAAEDRGAA